MGAYTEKAEARCECPSGYEFTGTSCQQIPLCNRNIENVCAPPEGVLECVNVRLTDWTCVCADGYAVVRTPTTRTCEPASNTQSCSNKPCGTVRVESCEDLEEGGVKCTCSEGYILQKKGVGQNFRCTPADPCISSPCDSATVAKQCSRTASGSYHCTCLDTAELVEATETEGPYCKRIEESIDVLPYLGVVAGGIAFVALGFGIWWFGFRSGGDEHEECDYAQASCYGPEG
ncbi:putative microneme protein [Cyclospora cayetanensis]|uniref:Microneme protein n=1 Tax=Cyclospora cayetanensis TaxID=88456 RepID=A0A1D3D0H9_9EIME|nr:putative microneme protein [Cyclospora cayetanensis]